VKAEQARSGCSGRHLDRFPEGDVAGVAATAVAAMGRPGRCPCPDQGGACIELAAETSPWRQPPTARSWARGWRPCAQRPKPSWHQGHGFSL